MGTSVLLFFCALFLALTTAPAAARAENPAEAMDHIWHAYAHLDPHRGSVNFRPQFWKLSRKVAWEQGLAVIPPVLDRAKTWRGEEGLIYVMLMVSLPKDQTVAVLEKYKAQGHPWEKQAATDFLIEIQEGYPEELAAMSPAERKRFLQETTP